MIQIRVKKKELGFIGTKLTFSFQHYPDYLKLVLGLVPQSFRNHYQPYNEHV